MPVSNSAGVGDHEIKVHTGNGHGSVNTKIRRFTTVLKSVGNAIEYSDSSTLGAKFTVKESGIFAITYMESANSGWYYGVTLNTSQPTVGIYSVGISERLALWVGNQSVTLPITVIVKLTAGDVIRPHTEGTTAGIDDFTNFSIRKIG